MAQLQNAVKISGLNVGRSLRDAYVAASVPTWEDAGRQFHLKLRDHRFSHRHATEAGYTPRQAKYTKQKFRKFGHTYPLQWSGETRRLVATARITARAGTGQINNQGGVKIAYPGARKLNFRNPHTDINMADEFRRVTDRETTTLGQTWQTRFSIRFNKG